ncbi:hypothetical protein IX336_000232 [Porphyromonas levii]|uniref:HIRAN domain-containing protein n=1 Tax=Porphyromonas levii TaxID=28114 RepID=UPI001BA72BE4|nr:HIRAN domain-containing protein [Porphyromonas levii]MBR8764879.1 hypothetical protein [Porphyromonas levii]
MKILDEAIEINKKFNTYWEQAQSFYQSEIDPSYRKVNEGVFMTSFGKNSNTVILYFVIDGCILRQGSIEVDLAFFFPITDQTNGDILVEGVSMSRLRSINQENTFFKFSLKQLSGTNTTLYSKAIIEGEAENTLVKDDRGVVWNGMDDIPSLSSAKLPKKLQVNYPLVGVYYRARYTKEEDMYCVLVAEIDNPHDASAIRVLRWDAQKRTDGKISLIGNVFFDLGFIAKENNEQLHQYMVKNNCRILFAKRHKSTLQILGGIEVLKNDDLYYPNCLLNIPINE